MPNLSELPPLALYIHFPWCVHKCPYCDFNSHELKSALPEAEYLQALLADLDQELPEVWGRSVISVFLGGGTPSLFSPETMEKLISALRARLNLKADIEITLEANPGTLEREKFSEYRDAGINRLSIGVQSFSNDHLQKLGRIHNARDAIRAAETAHKAGLDNFNLDLMYALPEQTHAQAENDIATAIDLCPAHISHYQLTIEPNTLFYHQPPALPDDDDVHRMELHCRERLAGAGFAQYEVSAYAKPDRQCRHNLNYWQFGDYLGIGAGAHGKLSDARLQQVSRSWKRRHPREYMASAGGPERIDGSRLLDTADLGFEFMLNAMRLCNGVEIDMFSRRTGLALETLGDALHKAQELELIEIDQQRMRPSARGLNYLNDLTGLFLQEASDAD